MSGTRPVLSQTGAGTRSALTDTGGSTPSPLTETGDSTRFDPVLAEVIAHELAAVGEEMAVVTWRTGRSPMLKSGDFATAVCDAHGRILVRGFAATFQLAVFSDLIVHLNSKYGDRIRPADAFLSNDPAHSSTHLPDVAIAMPVFRDGELLAFCAAYSHHADIGGRFPGGSSSEPTSSFEEGVVIPAVKVVDRGETNTELLDLIAANVRAPDEWLADLQSKLAGCRRGCEGMSGLLERFGVDAFRAAGEHLLRRSEGVARAAIRDLPDGCYEAQSSVRDEGIGSPDEIVLRLALTVRGDELHADLTGSSPEVSGAVNMPALMTRAAIYGAVKCVLAPRELANSGFFVPIHVTAPPGTIVNPRPNAAVGGRAAVFFWTYDLALKALALAVPDRVGVPGEATDMMHFTGRDREGDPGAVLDIYCGGWGARADRDGIDGVAPLWYEVFGTIPAELIERQYPIVVEGFGFVPDTGGPGKHRGSVAVFRQWRFLQDGEVMIRNVRLKQEPGFADGQAGVLPRTWLQRDGELVELPLRSTLQQKVRAGDVLYHATAGAGGHGLAHERPIELVLGDLRAGLISADAAAGDYGVALDADGGVDQVRTAGLRAEARARAGPGAAGRVDPAGSERGDEVG